MDIAKRKLMVKKMPNRPLSAADEDFEEEKSNKNYSQAKPLPLEKDNNLNFISVSGYKNVKDPKRNMILSKFEEKRAPPFLSKQNSGSSNNNSGGQNNNNGYNVNSLNASGNKMINSGFSASNQGERINSSAFKSLESSFLSNSSNKSAKQFEKYEKNSIDKEKYVTKPQPQPQPRAKSKPQASSSNSDQAIIKADSVKRSSEFSDAHYSLTAASTELGSQARNLVSSLETSGVIQGTQSKSSRRAQSQKQISSEEKKPQRFELKELLEDLEEEIESFEKNGTENDYFQREEWKVVKKNDPDARKKSAYNNPQFKSIALMLENLEKRKNKEVETLKNHVETVKRPSSESQNNSFVVFPNYFEKLVDRTFEHALANRESEDDLEKLFSSVQEYKRQLDVAESSSGGEPVGKKQADILKNYRLMSELDAVIAEKERKLRDLQSRGRLDSENSSQVTDSQLEDMSLEELRSRTIFITDVKRQRNLKKRKSEKEPEKEPELEPSGDASLIDQTALMEITGNSKKSERQMEKDFIKKNKENAFKNTIDLVTNKLPEQAKRRLDLLMKDIEEKLVLNEAEKNSAKPKNSKTSALRQEVSEMRVQEENAFQQAQDLEEKLKMIDEQLKIYRFEEDAEEKQKKILPKVKVLREEVELRENSAKLSEINELLAKIAEKERNQELEDAGKIQEIIAKLKDSDKRGDPLPRLDTKQKLNEELFEEVGRLNSMLLEKIEKANPLSILEEVGTLKNNLETATRHLEKMQEHYERHLWEDIKKEYKDHQRDYLKEMLKKLQEENEEIAQLHNKTVSFETRLQEKMEEELKRLSDPDYLPKIIERAEPEEATSEANLALPEVKEMTTEEYDKMIREKLKQEKPELFGVEFELGEFPKEEDLGKNQGRAAETSEMDTDFTEKEAEESPGEYMENVGMTEEDSKIEGF